VILWKVLLCERLHRCVSALVKSSKHHETSVRTFRAGLEEQLTVSLELSPIFLPARSLIHLEVLSSPPEDVKPGTTRGILEVLLGRLNEWIERIEAISRGRMVEAKMLIEGLKLSKLSYRET